MKKTLLLLLCIASIASAHAQISKLFSQKKKTPASKTASSSKPKKDWSKVDFSKRAADHFMIQYGADSWTGKPDSVKTKGFSRHFNFYFMMDKPFKSNPHYSVAYGLGLGTSNIFFDRRYVDVKAPSAQLPFTNEDSSTHFNKFKLVTMYVQVPVELRYFSNPENPNRSWKYAIGAKVGTLLKAYTKGKNLVDKNGNSYYGSSYISKESSKKFLNSTMLSFTGRIGYGNISLNADYMVTGVLKSGTGPVMNTLSIGLTISGL